MLKPSSFLNTLAISSLVALGPLSTDMYLPALPRIVQEFNSDSGTIQLTLSLFLVGFAFAQIIYGPLSDRYGRKPVLLAGLLLFVFSSVGCALSENANALILFRFLQALGGSAGPVLGRAMVRDIHGPQNSAKVLSHIGTMMALAPSVAPIAGGFMSVFWGWQSIFWFLALFGMLGSLLLFYQIEESAPEEYRHPKSISKILGDYATLIRDRLFIGYTLTCTFSYAGLFSFISGSSYVIIEYYGVPSQWFGFLFTLVVIGFVSGTFSGGLLSNTRGYKQLVAIGSAICLVSGAAMLLLAMFNPPHVAFTIIPMMIFMLGVGLVMPQSMAGALANYPHIAGSASGLLGFTQMTTAGLVGIVIGHNYDGTPMIMSSMIALMGVLALLSYLTLIHFKQRQIA